MLIVLGNVELTDVAIRNIDRINFFLPRIDGVAISSVVFIASVPFGWWYSFPIAKVFLDPEDYLFLGVIDNFNSIVSIFFVR